MKKEFEKKAACMTDDEKSFIDAFVAAYCRPHSVVMAERLSAFVEERGLSLVDGRDVEVALAAGPSAPQPEVRTPDEEVRFVFASCGAADGPDAWRAEMTVPPRATAETMISIRVVDGAGKPVDDAMLKLAGCSLPLLNGMAEMPFGLFLAGIKNTKVSLKRGSSGDMDGSLLFF